MTDEEEPLQLRRAPASAAPPPDDDGFDDEQSGWFAGPDVEESRVEAPRVEKRPLRALGDRSTARWPSNELAEAALLGALMIDNRLVDGAKELVSADHFFFSAHARIFDAIIASCDAGLAASPVTLAPRFAKDPLLKDAGGAAYLAQLTGSGAALIGWRDFAMQLRELSHRRRLLELADTLNEAMQDGTDLNAIQTAHSAIEEAMTATQPITSHDDGATAAEAVKEAVDGIERARDGEEPEGFRIALYEDWNRVAGRSVGGRMTLLGGRTSMGKTAVSSTVSLGAAWALAAMADDPGAVDHIILEGGRAEIMKRMIATLIYEEGRTPKFEDWTEGRYSWEDKRRIDKARADIEQLPLYLYSPASGMFVEDLRGFVRRRNRVWARQGRRNRFLVIDYLGKFRTRKTFSQTHERVSYVSGMIQQIAKSEDTAILALAQLGRGLDSREEKRPILSDLRDSGSLEMDADNVAFVYRDEYYLDRMPRPTGSAKAEEYDIDLAAARNRLELIGAKRRQGGLIRKTGWFHAPYQSIRSSEWSGSLDLFNRDEDDDDGKAFL